MPIVGEVQCTRENMNDDLGVAATLLRFEKFLMLPWSYPRRLALLFTLPLRALRVTLRRYPEVMVLELGWGRPPISAGSFRLPHPMSPW